MVVNEPRSLSKSTESLRNNTFEYVHSNQSETRKKCESKKYDLVFKSHVFAHGGLATKALSFFFGPISSLISPWSVWKHSNGAYSARINLPKPPSGLQHDITNSMAFGKAITSILLWNKYILQFVSIYHTIYWSEMSHWNHNSAQLHTRCLLVSSMKWLNSQSIDNHSDVWTFQLKWLDGRKSLKIEWSD